MAADKGMLCAAAVVGRSGRETWERQSGAKHFRARVRVVRAARAAAGFVGGLGGDALIFRACEAAVPRGSLGRLTEHGATASH
jgi:hypothetical protein